MSKISRPSITPLPPDHFTHNVWGGHWIPRLKGLRVSKEPVGESWEFSGPFLVKLIDARENLSLQVHPNDAYARRHEQSSGKAESWVILEAGSRAGQGYIYLGFNPSIRRRYKSPASLKAGFRQTLAECNALNVQQAERKILPFLNRIRVRPGEIYNLKPGTLHAVGKGVRLFEIQQMSDLTYRVWDWNRRVRRPLHLSKAFDVIRFVPQSTGTFRGKPKLVRSSGSGAFKQSQLIANRAAGFSVDELILKRKGSRISQLQNKRFSVLTVLEGTVTVTTSTSAKEYRVRAGYSILISGFVNRYEVRSETSNARILKSFVSR